MRKLARGGLSPTTKQSLEELTQRVLTDSDPKEKVKSLWASKSKKTFTEVKSVLVEMASGRARCMYCEDSMGTDIEHFWPKATYPERAFAWENYLLACSYCNSNRKRNLFPLDSRGEPLLIDPTVDEPREHLLFLPVNGKFLNRSTKGQESINVFGLNDVTAPRQLPQGRKEVFLKLQGLLSWYDQLVAVNSPKAEAVRVSMKNEPFSAVLDWLVLIAATPAGAIILEPGIAELVERHKVSTWRDAK